MKKYISLLLALILSLALCVPMLADEGGTTDPAGGATVITDNKTKLTVNSSVQGYTADYEAYKLLNLTTSLKCDEAIHTHGDGCYDGETLTCTNTHTAHNASCYAYAYTVNPTYVNVILTVLNEGEDDADKLTATDKELDKKVYDTIAAMGTNDIRAFADAVIDEIDKDNNLKADATFETKQEVSVDQGYWLIVDVTENPSTTLEDTKVIKSLVMLDTAGMSALTVTAKDRTASLTKEIVNGSQKLSSTSAQYGEIVPFELTSDQIPSNLAEYTKYTFKITDTMSKGLTYNEDLTVNVGTTSVSAATKDTEGKVDAATGYVLTVTTDKNNKTTIVVDLSAYLFANKANEQNPVAGKVVTVNYSATVNTDAELGTVDGNPNEAKLTFTNDPKYGTEGETVPDEVEVYSAKITVVKVDGQSKVEGQDSSISYTKKLAGAEFKLYKMSGDNKVYYKFAEADAEKDTPAEVKWVTENEADVKVSDTNGELEFKGLAAGTYYLEETEAPDGYNLLANPVEVKVDYAENDNTTYLANTSVNVENNSGTELPSTGGIGTTIFYAVGGALMAGAVILLITKKKMSNEE